MISEKWWSFSLGLGVLNISIGLCKKGEPPLLKHWSYVFLAPTHRHDTWYFYLQMTMRASVPFTVGMTLCVCGSFLLISPPTTNHPTDICHVNSRNPSAFTRQSAVAREQGMNSSRRWRCKLTPEYGKFSFNATDCTKDDWVPRDRNLSCDRCFLRNYTWLHRPRGVCQVFDNQFEHDLVFVFLILSISPDFDGRALIRRSWASVTQSNTAPDLRHAFLIGSAPDSASQKAIDMEQAAYNDIIQQNIPESHKTLTQKTLMGLEWATVECNRSRYIFKTDTDSYVGIAGLFSALDALSPDAGMFGACNAHSSPYRAPDHKHFVSLESYPEQYTPPFCMGAGYGLSLAAARAVLQVSPNVPYISLEDGYVGLCLRELRFRGIHDYKVVRIARFLRSAGGLGWEKNCGGIQFKPVWHSVLPEFIEKAWRECHEFKCDFV